MYHNRLDCWWWWQRNKIIKKWSCVQTIRKIFRVMYFDNTLLCCLISCEKSEWVCFNFVRNFFEIFFFHFAAWNPGLRRCWCWELWSGSCYWPAAVVAAESVLRVARRTTECTRPHGRDKVHVTKIAKKNKINKTMHGEMASFRYRESEYFLGCYIWSYNRGSIVIFHQMAYLEWIQRLTHVHPLSLLWYVQINHLNTVSSLSWWKNGINCKSSICYMSDLGYNVILRYLWWYLDDLFCPQAGAKGILHVLKETTERREYSIKYFSMITAMPLVSKQWYKIKRHHSQILRLWTLNHSHSLITQRMHYLGIINL